MRATGIDAIVKQFEGRFSVLGCHEPLRARPCDLVRERDPARGNPSVHAEVWRSEEPQIAALRYDDQA